MMKYAGDLISALIRHVRLHSKNAVSNFGNTRQPQWKLKNNIQKCASPSSSEKSCMFPVRRQPLVAIEIIMAAKEEVRQSSSQLREAVGSKMHMTFPQEAAILVQRATKSHCQWFFTECDVSICRIRSFLVKDATQLLGQARQNHRGAPCFQSTQILPCDPPILHWLPVAAHIRFDVTVLAFKAVNRTAPIYLQTLVRHQPSQRANKGRLSEVKTPLCSAASVVEWTTAQCHDSRVTRHLPQKTRDSLVQTSPPPCIARLLPIPERSLHAIRSYLFCIFFFFFDSLMFYDALPDIKWSVWGYSVINKVCKSIKRHESR